MKFEEVYNKDYTSLYRYCYRLLGNADETKDLVQETFVRYYDMTRSGTEIISPLPWLFRVATNLIRNHAKMNKRQTELQNESQPIPVLPDTAETELIRKQSIGHVRTAMKQLSTRDQALLNLYQERRTYTEIAEILDINKSSVGTLLARAIDRLRMSGALRGHQ